MIKLLNSAMMPAVGYYSCKKIDSKLFAKLIKDNDFESYIGYQDTANHIAKISGEEIKTSRNLVELQDGDIILVCKLKYRVQNPGEKGKFTPDVNDFEYYYIYYSEGVLNNCEVKNG